MSRKYINSFIKFNLLIESLDNLHIVEYKQIPGYKKKYKEYRLMSNDTQLAYMGGLKYSNKFHLYVIKVENNFRGKNLGETLIIEYLKKYGGQVISMPLGRRSPYADKMWERISKRDDVNIEIKKEPLPYKPYYVNHYWASLKE